MKVEPIKDHPTAGRVLLPERMISYVSGPVKRISNNTNKPMNSLRRISRDDVERLSRGQPAKVKGSGSRSVPHRLNDVERTELHRAQKKGFVAVLGGGNRRTRKGSPLVNIFRQWCDAREKPQIILYKSTGSESKEPLDRILVDLSPLRLHGFHTEADAENIVNEYKLEIEAAAMTAGMRPVLLLKEHDSVDYAGCGPLEECDGEACHDDEEDDDRSSSLSINDTSDAVAKQKVWATRPIWQLPFLSAGEYKGERSHAKAMAKALSCLWDIAEPDKVLAVDDNNSSNRSGGPQSRRTAGAKKGGRSKMKGLSQQRSRGGGHRQSWY